VTDGVSGTRRAGALRRFGDRYVRHWRARTICRPKLATERCANGPPLRHEEEAGLAAGPSPRG
jgi:hypothetical protein